MNVIYPCCRRMYADQQGRYKMVNGLIWDTELERFTRSCPYCGSKIEIVQMPYSKVDAICEQILEGCE